VPATVDESTHADGLPAEVSFAPGVATAQGRAPEWSRASLSCTNTWCHGPEPATTAAPPRWTDPTPLGCTSCHGAPPSAPHPQIDDCSLCHGAVVAADDRSFVDRARHVDGTVDVSVPTSCTACHGGSIDAAPVPGTPGAGAHRAHLDGSARAAAVPCAACHVIPGAVLAPGHLDTPRPAEVTFSGNALAYDATPVYSPASATCAGTPCHGGRFPDGNASGGTNTTPDWTRVDGTQATCGSCHAIPPPKPHLPVEFAADCSACHQDIAPDNQTFLRPDLHVDGTVTFAVP
jgi:predicted CxxxxCH...CXXCH cytochrome family protein